MITQVGFQYFYFYNNEKQEKVLMYQHSVKVEFSLIESSNIWVIIWVRGIKRGHNVNGWRTAMGEDWTSIK